jgi:hypothetical protein
MAGGILTGWQPRRAPYSGRRAVTLFMLVAVVYAIGAELSWHSFGSGLAFGFPPAGVDGGPAADSPAVLAGGDRRDRGYRDRC